MDIWGEWQAVMNTCSQWIIVFKYCDGNLNWCTSYEGNLATSINILDIHTIFDLETPGLRICSVHTVHTYTRYKWSKNKITYTNTMQNIQQLKTDQVNYCTYIKLNMQL